MVFVTNINRPPYNIPKHVIGQKKLDFFLKISMWNGISIVKIYKNHDKLNF
jgi:hypothetical protein